MAQSENLLEPRRIREIGRFRRLGDPGDWEIRGFGGLGKSLYVAGVGNAVGANTWEADELGNWGLGSLRRLEDSGDWKVSEIGKFGRIRRFGGFGGVENSGVWEIR